MVLNVACTQLAFLRCHCTYRYRYILDLYDAAVVVARIPVGTQRMGIHNNPDHLAAWQNLLSPLEHDNCLILAPPSFEGFGLSKMVVIFLFYSHFIKKNTQILLKICMFFIISSYYFNIIENQLKYLLLQY